MVEMDVVAVHDSHWCSIVVLAEVVHKVAAAAAAAIAVVHHQHTEVVPMLEGLLRIHCCVAVQEENGPTLETLEDRRIPEALSAAAGWHLYHLQTQCSKYHQ